MCITNWQEVNYGQVLKARLTDKVEAAPEALKWSNCSSNLLYDSILSIADDRSFNEGRDHRRYTEKWSDLVAFLGAALIPRTRTNTE